MEKARGYPPQRRRRGEMKEAGLMMLSARIEEELCEYVQKMAFESRRSKQDIVAEALKLHRQHHQQDLTSE